MKKMTVLYAGLMLLASLAGCTPSFPGLYYWGDYSNTLYDMKKNPGEKSVKAHTNELNKIITMSDKFKKRVPPGIYCEYGYMLLKAGNEQEAKKYFDLEMKTYPESKVFIDRLLIDIEKNKEKISENAANSTKESK